MLNRLSAERVLLRIELHALADAQLQGIIAHAAGALQAIENRRPPLILRQALHENLDAAHAIQGAQMVVEVVRVSIRLFTRVYQVI